MQAAEQKRSFWQRPLHAVMQACAKPQGRKGSFMLSFMEAGHSPLTDWGLTHLTLEAGTRAVDIGCGSGLTVQKLLELCPEGHVTGVDYSPLAVERSREKNEKAIKEGRCNILEGNAADLPFEDNSFDFAIAVETIYFWPKGSFQEVRRVLKPGGRFLAVCEADGTGPTDKLWPKVIDGMELWSREKLEERLNAAGFSSVETDTKSVSFGFAHWMCAIAKKQ